MEFVTKSRILDWLFQEIDMLFKTTSRPDTIIIEDVVYYGTGCVAFESAKSTWR